MQKQLYSTLSTTNLTENNKKKNSIINGQQRKTIRVPTLMGEQQLQEQHHHVPSVSPAQPARQQHSVADPPSFMHRHRTSRITGMKRKKATKQIQETIIIIILFLNTLGSKDSIIDVC